jgi:hypothetical protein
MGDTGVGTDVVEALELKGGNWWLPPNAYKVSEEDNVARVSL